MLKKMSMLMLLGLGLMCFAGGEPDWDKIGEQISPKHHKPIPPPGHHSEVPEPATFVLIGAGLAYVGYRKWRRQ